MLITMKGVGNSPSTEERLVVSANNRASQHIMCRLYYWFEYKQIKRRQMSF